MTAQTGTVLKGYFDAGDQPTAAQFTNFVDTTMLGAESMWIGLVTQSGTAAPTATVLANTTGATLSFGYSSTGTYTGSFTSGVMTTAKTAILCAGGGRGGTNGLIEARATDDDALSIVTYSLGANPALANAVLAQTLLAILIFA